MNQALIADKILGGMIHKAKNDIVRGALERAALADMIGGKLVFNASRDDTMARHVWRMAESLVSACNYYTTQEKEFLKYFAQKELEQTSFPLIQFPNEDSNPSGGSLVPNPVAPKPLNPQGKKLKASMPF